MKYPIKKDRNYTITKEWTGKDRPQFVIRFCNEWVDSKPSLSKAMFHVLDDVLGEEASNEIQTYNMSKALEFFRQGHEVYLAHPLDEDDDQKMHNKEEFEDGYLYIIKGQLGEVQS